MSFLSAEVHKLCINLTYELVSTVYSLNKVPYSCSLRCKYFKKHALNWVDKNLES